MADKTFAERQLEATALQHARMAVHHEAFIKGECPQDISDQHDHDVLSWLAAKRLHEQG